MIAIIVELILSALLKLQVATTAPPAVQQVHMLAELQLAMLVELENIAEEQSLIAKIVELGNTTIKRNEQQRLIAKVVELGNMAQKLAAKIPATANPAHQ
jgi:hypothetical protein